IDDGAFVLEELLNGTTIDDVIQTTDAEIRLGECFLKRGPVHGSIRKESH
ncbi:acyl CoA:acetate/3-ketoacid CoA transferase subunit beta, partial [Bacillus velezensis]